MRTLPKYVLGSLLLAIQLPVSPCACTPMPPAGSASRATSNAPWDGRIKELFNDSLDPSAVGLSGVSVSDAGGAVSARGQEAQFIVRVRVVTVATEGAGRNLRYLLSLRIVGDPIAGPRAPYETLQLAIGQDNPSFGIAKSKDLDLAGMTFIAFLRDFKQDGTTVMHWHLARDGADVVDAARKGAVLSEIKRE